MLVEKHPPPGSACSLGHLKHETWKFISEMLQNVVLGAGLGLPLPAGILAPWGKGWGEIKILSLSDK